MKHMTAVVPLAAVAIAAPVEVEKRDDQCPPTATVAWCPNLVLVGNSMLCRILPLGSECLAVLYCCDNKGDNGLVNVDLLNCDQLL